MSRVRHERESVRQDAAVREADAATGGPARQRRRPDPARRQDILDAAEQVFLKKGYDATSVQDIADAVGLLKGSLYHYVSSKEDFLFGVIEPVYQAALDTVVRVADTDKPALERLADFVRAHVVFVSEHMSAFKIRLREFSQLSPGRREQLHEQGEIYNAALQRILNDGRASGDIDSALDLRLTTLVMIGELNSLTQWYHADGRYSAKRLGRHLAGMMTMSVASDQALTTYGGTTGLRAL